jgi:tRNA A37 threonylcarbamoyltransferase TsaD
MALILGLESTCDETAAAIVEDGRKVLSNIVAPKPIFTPNIAASSPKSPAAPTSKISSPSSAKLSLRQN